jgi:hypothetical protein
MRNESVDVNETGNYRENVMSKGKKNQKIVAAEVINTPVVVETVAVKTEKFKHHLEKKAQNILYNFRVKNGGSITEPTHEMFEKVKAVQPDALDSDIIGYLASPYKKAGERVYTGTKGGSGLLKAMEAMLGMMTPEQEEIYLALKAAMAPKPKVVKVKHIETPEEKLAKLIAKAQEKLAAKAQTPVTA